MGIAAATSTCIFWTYSLSIHVIYLIVSFKSSYYTLRLARVVSFARVSKVICIALVLHYYAQRLFCAILSSKQTYMITLDFEQSLENPQRRMQNKPRNKRDVSVTYKWQAGKPQTASSMGIGRQVKRETATVSYSISEAHQRWQSNSIGWATES